MPGERGGLILPKLLRPGALTSHEQRVALRSQAGKGRGARKHVLCRAVALVKTCMLHAGVENVGDLGRLLEGLPRPLVDFLKVCASDPVLPIAIWIKNVLASLTTGTAA